MFEQTPKNWVFIIDFTHSCAEFKLQYILYSYSTSTMVVRYIWSGGFILICMDIIRMDPQILKMRSAKNEHFLDLFLKSTSILLSFTLFSLKICMSLNNKHSMLSVTLQYIKGKMNGNESYFCILLSV